MGTQEKSIYIGTVLQYASNYQSSYAWKPISDYGQVGSHFCWFGHNYASSAADNSICIPISAFTFSGTGTHIQITVDAYMPESHNYYWALCTSSDYKSKYQGHSPVSSRDDPTQLGTGTFYLATYPSGTHRGTGRVDIDASFPSGTNLYLFFWSKETSANAAIHVYGNISIAATYDPPAPPQPQGIAHIDTGSSYASYTAWIDSGSGWVQYEPYLDTGSGWVLLT